MASVFNQYIGKGIFARMVTFHDVGRLTEVSECGKFIKLEDPAWIPDSGPFAEAIKNGQFKDFEPFGRPVWVAIDSIVDWIEWPLDKFHWM